MFEKKNYESTKLQKLFFIHIFSSISTLFLFFKKILLLIHDD